ncbi:MAG TPA: aminotransferase class IV [Pyrinomonadaceae bacterium]|nr:aminotransferase class IV [Pyrinomonadaceae bacterium]
MEAAKARAEVVVSAVSLYGRGVFTTIAIYEGHPFLWDEHWSRLSEHAARVRVDISELEKEVVRALLAQLIEANHVKDGLARISLVATADDRFWNMKRADERKTDLLIMTGEAQAVSEDGMTLTVSPYRANTLSPLAGLKSINYLEHILAREEARSRDFDEAVTLNERGEIVSATMANIFWVADGHVHTPALHVGALAGTTRARVIELAHELSIPLVEGVYELSDLSDANEIFLTSASQGIQIVTTFDFHRYTITVGSIALRLHEAFRQLTLHAD